MSLDLNAIAARASALDAQLDAVNGTGQWIDPRLVEDIPGDIAGLFAALAAVERDRDWLSDALARSETLVAAATAWRHAGGEPGFDAAGALIAAVDEWEAVLDAKPSGTGAYAAPLTDLIGIAPVRAETFEEAAAYLAAENDADIHGEDLDDSGTEAGQCG